ncbi:DUF802 domain-containing protein [Pseudorhodoferax sp. Leaf274]|uniref:DUF802 domain-containing protein n=1 Tax=Pseudorhodoferax sp. Leaf274 TaxID=1736318 RepID=UPI000703948F|nr:DUF802 domain-containing protein [Pseudorhodoferax sp. Leaf274]KQP47741.1 hypothetical protein ASF44_24090 [Pseudorhodoferax sp. Leaf274]
MNRVLHHAVLLAGLACIAWVGAGYAGSSHLLALAITALIGAFFVFGALELWRFRQATDQLAGVLAASSAPPAALGPWLERLPATLRHPVRLRIEGQRVALPGPTLTPYLAGFLVLLGMLGTFLGMVVTLRGTGLALQGATDLASVRAALAAPVTGLGVAFGTSLAGVAASATLGLAAALARRERLLAGQQLDQLASTVLRPFSEAQRRDDSFQLLRQQAEAMPALVDKLSALVQGMERQGQQLHERLLADQQGFHSRTEAAYTGLAGAVDRSLKDSLAESARLAGAAIQPAVEATMAGVAREAAALHAGAAQGVQQQLEQLAQRFAASAEGVSRAWTEALAEQRSSQAELGSGLQGSLNGFTQSFAQRSVELVEQVSAQLARSTGALEQHWQDSLARHAQANASLASDTHAALAGTTAQFAQHTATLLQTVEQAHAQLQHQVDARDAQRLAAWSEALARHELATQTLASDTQQALAATAAGFGAHAQALQQGVAQAHADLQAQAAARNAEQLAAWSEALARHEAAQQTLASHTREALAGASSGFVEQVATLQQQVAQRDAERLAAWTEALAQHERSTQAHGTETRQALASAADGFSHHAAVLQATVTRAHAELQAQAEARDAERLAGWNETLTAMSGLLAAQWREASAHSLEQQQRICAALAETAQAMGERAEAQASATVAEIGRLVDAAAQAPRAAAEVIAELRDKLTDSMARDNAMLDERARVLDTLRTLLDAVNHASSEQRAAIDALVSGSAELLERAGERFATQVEDQGSRLAASAAQLGAGAAEVASLGEAFGAAVQLFSASNTQLGAHLQQVDETLGKSIARSDEQLAYYVAQAREVIDLSLLSQKQIVEDLQRLASERSAQAVPA